MVEDETPVRKVRVEFGLESYMVEVEVDPGNPPTEDTVIDMARRMAIERYQPDQSFRKGVIIT